MTVSEPSGGNDQQGDPARVDCASGYALWDAAYILGALTPDERWAYEGHLRGCLRCRESVAEICGIPALLGLLDKAAAVAALNTGHASVNATDATCHAPIARNGSAPHWVAAMVRRRRRRRVVTVVAAVAVAAAGLAIPRVVLSLSGTAGDTTVSLSASATRIMAARVALTNQVGGTRISVWSRSDSTQKCHHHDDDVGRTVALTLTDDDGAEVRVATWTISEGEVAPISATTSWPISAIHRIAVVAADNDVLLQTVV